MLKEPFVDFNLEIDFISVILYIGYLFRSREMSYFFLKIKSITERK